MNYCITNDELYHHGILGQKWGVRRFQNKDGTLTDQGKRRYEKFDSKSYKEELNKQAESRGMSKIGSAALINNAAALAKSRDKQTWKHIQRQDKLLNKMDEAHTIGDTKKMAKLGKKWIHEQTSIRMNQLLDDSDQIELGEAFLKYRMQAASGAFVGGAVGGLAVAAAGAADKKSYLSLITDAGAEGKKLAVSDYEKFKKQRGY